MLPKDMRGDETRVAPEIIAAIKAGHDTEAARAVALEILSGANKQLSVSSAAALIYQVMRHAKQHAYEQAATEVEELSRSLREGVRLPRRS